MSKQAFKGLKLSRTMVKNNIMKVYNMCEIRHMDDWYVKAKVLSINTWVNFQNHYGLKIGGIAKVTGILAATSPMKRWEENIKLTQDFLANGKCGHFGAVNEKCKRILESGGSDTEILDILGGRKTQRFYMSIKYPLDYGGVTIDRHALSIALGYRISNETFSCMTKKQYEFFEECYRYTASHIGITPMLLQSSTWQVFRERKLEFKKEK
jgi:hypothetical protein